MKKILKHLRENWVRHGFETLVVTVGILGAFSLNNWNEGRKAAQTEQVHLNNIYQDLVVEESKLNAMIQRRVNKANSAERMLSYHNGKKVEDIRGFYADLVTVILEDRHSPNNNSFKELMNSGNLSVLKNDNLRLLLLEIDSDYKILLNGEIHHLEDNQRHLYSNYGSDIDFESATMVYMDSLSTVALSKADMALTLNNRSIKNGIFLAMFMNQYLASHLTIILNKVIECKNLIHKELD